MRFIRDLHAAYLWSMSWVLVPYTASIGQVYMLITIVFKKHSISILDSFLFPLFLWSFSFALSLSPSSFFNAVSWLKPFHQLAPRYLPNCKLSQTKTRRAIDFLNQYPSHLLILTSLGLPVCQKNNAMSEKNIIDLTLAKLKNNTTLGLRVSRKKS